MPKSVEGRIEAELTSRIEQRTAIVAVLGLGYVGLPLAVATARAGFLTVGIDTDGRVSENLNLGRSHLASVADEELSLLVRTGRLHGTTDVGCVAGCDVIVICVPTPLDIHRHPDLSFVEAATREIERHCRPGRLVVLESTSYPGTTREVVKPILEANGLRSETDFLLGFSPEREDPGNREFSIGAISKIVSGDGPAAKRAVETFYGAVVSSIVSVSSPNVAEAAKLTENVFRAVNIALINELKMVFESMGIDIWEVIEAARSKPFGFMPFYPGPGVGGHCVPIDPVYLTWRSQRDHTPTPLIDMAGEINGGMPLHVVGRVEEAIVQRLALGIQSARILLLGVAYKRNVSDIRESPAMTLIALLEGRGANVDFHDPHVPTLPPMRDHPELDGRLSIPLTAETIERYQAILIATDHDDVDYELVVDHASLIIDTRNICARRGLKGSNIFKA